jgi:hypothetical protein
MDQTSLEQSCLAMGGFRRELREVDAKFQGALASAPQEIPAEFQIWSAGHKGRRRSIVMALSLAFLRRTSLVARVRTQ